MLVPKGVYELKILEAGPPTGPGGRPPGLFVTHAQWVGGRPFRFSARAGRVGVVLKYMPGRAGGRSIFRPGAHGRRPVFDIFLPRDKGAILKLRLNVLFSLNICSHLSAGVQRSAIDRCNLSSKDLRFLGKYNEHVTNDGHYSLFANTRELLSTTVTQSSRDTFMRAGPQSSTAFSH